MPNPFADAVGILKRTMVLFFLVDASGSMSGEKIGQLNHCIEELLPELKAISADNNSEANLKIAVLKFSSGAKWMTSSPVPIENYSWQNISAGGCTDLGEACEMLNEKMSRSAFLNDEADSGYLITPTIVLFSGSEPTDNYQKGLKGLKNNNWYKHAIKIAVAFGDDFNHGHLEAFTGSKGNILVPHNLTLLKAWVRYPTIEITQYATDFEDESERADFDDENEGHMSITDLPAKQASKPDAKAIQDYLTENGVTYFYHFTAVDNLPSIKKLGGLYSWKALADRGIASAGGGGDLSRMLDRRHGYEDFVRLSFCSDHPMRYRLITEGIDTVLLMIDPRVAGFAETRFSNINATDNAHITGDDLAFLKEHVDLEATRQHYVSRENPVFKPHQAEIMVRHFIPLEYITNFEEAFA